MIRLSASGAAGIRSAPTLVLWLVAFAGAGASAAGQGPDGSGSASTIARARAAAEEFVRNWQYQWQTSQLIQHRMLDWISPPPGGDRVPVGTFQADSVAAAWQRSVPPAELRHNLFHCHPDGATTPRRTIVTDRSRPNQAAQPQVIVLYGGWRRMEEYIIESGVGKRAICPSWFQGNDAPPWDEGVRLDAAIIEPLQPAVRTARTRLLAVLEGAARERPDDMWLSGQRLRFAIDQGDAVLADQVVTTCAAASWWCLALRGYLSYVRMEVAAADSLFAASLIAMPDEERCSWSDLGILLPEPDRRRYAAVPCAERHELNETIWWLADPLYIEPGNERRVEHYARRMLVTLRSGTEFSERWDLRDEGGGAAVREMLIRYGWPSLSVWGGPEEDRSHMSYLGGGSWDHERFATAEYGPPRFHSIPAWNAVESPWDAQALDWVVTERAARFASPADTLWWPREHYMRRSGPLVQLHGQWGAFRRDSAALFAIATELDPSLVGYPGGDSVVGALAFAGNRASMATVPVGAVVGGTASFTAPMPSAPQLVALELRGRRDRGAALRIRFGVRPPPPLSAMAAGEVAVSSPVFLEAPQAGAMPVTAPGAALVRMLPTTRFGPEVKRVGVYWESYGAAFGDTVDVAVRIERKAERPGLFRRIGLRLGIGSQPGDGVSVVWREPSPERIVTPIPAMLPAQGRGVALDLSQLAPGDYSLIVSMGRAGRPAAYASRDFSILPP